MKQTFSRIINAINKQLISFKIEIIIVLTLISLWHIIASLFSFETIGIAFNCLFIFWLFWKKENKIEQFFLILILLILAFLCNVPEHSGIFPYYSFKVLQFFIIICFINFCYFNVDLILTKNNFSINIRNAINTIAYFEIQSSNPEREIDFYKTVFGWNFIKEEFENLEYYSIEANGINGGLLKRPATLNPKVGETNVFLNSIEVANFEHSSQLILDSGGQAATPKFAIIGRCWQGFFTDPDNNIFGIFEAYENVK